MKILDVENTEGLIEKIPSRMDDLEIVKFLKVSKFNSKHIFAIKRMSKLTDKRMSMLFDISERTLREFKSVKTNINRPLLKERSVLILTLLKHGRSVFGSDEKFQIWLNEENFILDGKKPISFLTSNAGINFIDDRLTGMEYGDNL